MRSSFFLLSISELLNHQFVLSTIFTTRRKKLAEQYQVLKFFCHKAAHFWPSHKSFFVYRQRQRLAWNIAQTTRPVKVLLRVIQGGIQAGKKEKQITKDSLLFQNHHLRMSQLDISSRITSLCWSIIHSAYIDRAAMAAFRCSGPTEPFLASSCDLQMQVARLRKSWLGVPNQYLSSDSC